MKNFFKKFKKPYFGSMGAILAFFTQNWAKMNFPGKKRLSQFLNIPIIYRRAKNQKKIICHSREKCRADRWMGRQT